MKTSPHFSAETLRIDPEETVAHLETAIRDIVARQLRRKGAVLGLSGGIDSSVTAALCVRALGPDRVIGLFMPEADTSPESLRLGKLVADSFQMAVAGTPNLLEYDQGFFVKNGDGAADFKPIAHLYKSQVYQLAGYLGVPEEIRMRAPTTDTYSLQQSQEEFYFSLPLEKMDLCLYARNHDIPAADVGAATGLTPAQVARVFSLIDSRRAAARYLHQRPMLIDAPEII